MNRQVRTLALACFVAVSFSPVAVLASGAGPGSETPAKASDPLAKARELINARQWPAAVAELKRVNATGDANWNNLMGYASRKGSPPDLAGAEKYYGAALAINPKHLGTLEYLGEMRLQQGDLPGAEKELMALKQATFLKSEEYKDLQAAIERYKAAGNKYVAKD